MPNEIQPEILPTLLARLVSHTYQELRNRDFTINWAKLHSFAEVRWSDDKSPITIRCDKSVGNWHEAAITGLLAHELSHPAQRTQDTKESQTDIDVIKRGLGVFLAFERMISGRYTDCIINRGKDRYLGYRTIRGQLEHYQKKQLDRLMEWRRIKPLVPKQAYDCVIVSQSNGLILSVGGYVFKGTRISPNADIKFIIRNSKTYIYADDSLVGKLDFEIQL